MRVDRVVTNVLLFVLAVTTGASWQKSQRTEDALRECRAAKDSLMRVWEGRVGDVRQRVETLEARFPDGTRYVSKDTQLVRSE